LGGGSLGGNNFTVSFVALKGCEKKPHLDGSSRKGKKAGGIGETDKIKKEEFRNPKTRRNQGNGEMGYFAGRWGTISKLKETGRRINIKRRAGLIPWGNSERGNNSNHRDGGSGACLDRFLKTSSIRSKGG